MCSRSSTFMASDLEYMKKCKLLNRFSGWDATATVLSVYFPKGLPVRKRFTSFMCRILSSKQPKFYHFP